MYRKNKLSTNCVHLFSRRSNIKIFMFFINMLLVILNYVM